VYSGSTDTTCHKILGGAAPESQGGHSTNITYLEGHDGTHIPGTRGMVPPSKHMRVSPHIAPINAVINNKSGFIDQHGRSFLIARRGRSLLKLIVPGMIEEGIFQFSSSFSYIHNFEVFYVNNEAFTFIYDSKHIFHKIRLSDMTEVLQFINHKTGSTYTINVENNIPFIYTVKSNAYIAKINGNTGEIVTTIDYRNAKFGNTDHIYRITCTNELSGPLLHVFEAGGNDSHPFGGNTLVVTLNALDLTFLRRNSITNSIHNHPRSIQTQLQNDGTYNIHIGLRNNTFVTIRSEDLTILNMSSLVNGDPYSVTNTNHMYIIDGTSKIRKYSQSGYFLINETQSKITNFKHYPYFTKIQKKILPIKCFIKA